MITILLQDDSQVSQCRREAVMAAQQIGFDETDAGRVAIVATELATNVLKHGGGGELLVGLFDDGDGGGIECIAVDKGPGIADVSQAMRDGVSTAGSAGNGMGAIARLSNVMDVFSLPERGAAVLARLTRKTVKAHPVRAPTYGVVSLPLPGETACGDGWCVRRTGDEFLAMVVDGLGHGPLAAAASHAAIKVFQSSNPHPSLDLVHRLHQALKSTRGAAASIVAIPTIGELTFVGVGNVAGVVVGDGQTRSMMSYNGTLGHALRSVKALNYPAEHDACVILASDGLSTSWKLEDYPSLKTRHPSLIAAVLYRDFSRRRDDLTVLVIKRGDA